MECSEKVKGFMETHDDATMQITELQEATVNKSIDSGSKANILNSSAMIQEEILPQPSKADILDTQGAIVETFISKTKIQTHVNKDGHIYLGNVISTCDLVSKSEELKSTVQNNSIDINNVNMEGNTADIEEESSPTITATTTTIINNSKIINEPVDSNATDMELDFTSRSNLCKIPVEFVNENQIHGDTPNSESIMKVDHMEVKAVNTTEAPADKNSDKIISIEHTAKTEHNLITNGVTSISEPNDVQMDSVGDSAAVVKPMCNKTIDVGIGTALTERETGTKTVEEKSSDVVTVINSQSSLCLLSQYESDEDVSVKDNSDTDSVISVDNKLDYREVLEISSDSERDSLSASDDESCSTKVRNALKKCVDLENVEDFDGDSNDDDDGNTRSRSSKTKKPQPPKVKGELLLDDLPPIEDLHITVPEDECTKFGIVHSIVDQLVLVNAQGNTMLLDLDTVLFLDKGKQVLGQVFDVLGQVADPLYCVRFNSHKHIVERGIKIGDIVYIAPKTEYTTYVILSKLMNNTGSDASWENDIEPPPRYLDYSDDEKERAARIQMRTKDRQSQKHKDDDEQTKRVRFDTTDEKPTTSKNANVVSSFAPRRIYTNIYSNGIPYKQPKEHYNNHGPYEFRPNTDHWVSNYHQYRYDIEQVPRYRTPHGHPMIKSRPPAHYNPYHSAMSPVALPMMLPHGFSQHPRLPFNPMLVQHPKNMRTPILRASTPFSNFHSPTPVEITNNTERMAPNEYSNLSTTATNESYPLPPGTE